MGFDENQYLDVLQNIEFAIVEEFRRDPAILDLNIREAVNALARQYESEEEGRTPPRPQMTGRTRAGELRMACARGAGAVGECFIGGNGVPSQRV